MNEVTSPAVKTFIRALLVDSTMRVSAEADPEKTVRAWDGLTERESMALIHLLQAKDKKENTHAYYWSYGGWLAT